MGELGWGRAGETKPVKRHYEWCGKTYPDSPGTPESNVDGIFRRYVCKVAEDDCKSELLRQTRRHGEMDTAVVVPQVRMQGDLLTSGSDQHHTGVPSGSGSTEPEHLPLQGV